MRRDEIYDTSESFHIDPEFLGRHFPAIARDNVLGSVSCRSPIGLGDGDNDTVVGFFPIVDDGVEKDPFWVPRLRYTAKNGFQSQQGEIGR